MSDPVASTLCVGIGSPHGNDGLGWIAAQELAQRFQDQRSHVEVRCARVPADLLDWIAGRKKLVLCDACWMHGEAGTIHRWEWPEPAYLESVTNASHGWNVSAVLQLAEQLQTLPSSVVIWGLEMGNAPCTGSLSVDGPLDAKVSMLVSRIIEEIRHA